MKHIVCIHPCGSSPAVGDESIVTDGVWSELKELKSGVYPIYALKRDLGSDEAPSEFTAPVEEASVAPTTEVPPAEDPIETSVVETEVPVESTTETTPEAPKSKRRQATTTEEPKAE